ncbi:hypothetical protein Vretimale_696 [Volvox reticuliferus]|uniref:Protein kinase domain-containing protein n=1 Tax=Volvox reticuliferus TaxID=1737510 RepID=A0A8J4D3C6_9CHLO|nr:hypothetical protein Vretimale_696 [Volvox reticuliferus]
MVTCTFAWCFPSLFRPHTSCVNASAVATPLPAKEVGFGQPKVRVGRLSTTEASRATGQHLEIRQDDILLSNNMDADELKPGNTTLTQPLPSLTEPQRVILRSISIGGNTRECSFIYATAVIGAEAVAGTQPASLEASEIPSEHAAHLKSDETPHFLRNCSTEKALSRGASLQALGALGTGVTAVPGDLSTSAFANPSQAALQEAFNGLDGLNPSDLTVDGPATAATARLRPDAQASSDSAVSAPPLSGAPAGVSKLEAGAVEPAHGSHTTSITAAARPGAAADERESVSGSESPAAAVPGEATSMPGGPTPQPLLNLSQVRDCVQELRVLHIRPGAALLIGESISNRQSVVARFELGWPASLLAPQLLTALQEGRCRPHPHVVTLLGVHAIGLPALVLETPMLRPSPLPPSPRHCNGSAAAAAAAAAATAEGQWESLDKDLATAARALRQAEVVRGASTSGSGPIGSTVTSSSTNPSTSDYGRPPIRILGAPHVRLCDVVGRLRAISGYGGSCAAGSTPHCEPPPLPSSPLPSSPLPLVANACPPSCPTDVASVTLSIMEVCSDGNLSDEIRRDAFRCCVPDSPAGSADTRHPPDLRYFTEAKLLLRLDRFVAIARQIALGLDFLHTTCGLPHGDLVSRNVLLQRRLIGDPWVREVTGYMAKLAGYGRLATSAAAIAVATATPTSDMNIVSGNSGGEAATSAAAGDYNTRFSATSISRINSVHVGLWRDVYSLAPERLRDPQAPPTFEADVYAYGTILYEMAVGEPPWMSMLPACVAVGVATGELRIHWNCLGSGRKSESGSGTHAPLPCIAALVERCTSPLPEDRPSLAQILASLDSIDTEIRSGRELAESLRQQRSSEKLMNAFLSSSSSFDSRVRTGGSTWVDMGEL